MSTLCSKACGNLAQVGLSRLFSEAPTHTLPPRRNCLRGTQGKITDMEFIQFHPTALMIPGQDAFLLSEAIRGEGAYLLDKNGERFMQKIHPMAELAPRDTVASAIYNQMKKDQTQNVYLTLQHLDKNYIKERFSVIYEEILKKGVDITQDLIPIAPAAHYMVGGIRTDLTEKLLSPGFGHAAKLLLPELWVPTG
jgi:L-aspartate oxidase